jgi:peptide/nickel transport system substrate-binding protein
MTIVYDGLTAFKRVGGPEGNQLLPDLAEEIRPPTDDGLTYAYTLRAGLKYSDGSPARASDVRSTFERLIRADQFGGSFLGSLKGSEACTPEKCDLSSSVVANDDARTIVFHLGRANSDFPYILALPNLGIVPSSAPPTNEGTTPIPGTGPYRIVSGELEPEGESATRGTVILGRNPHFRSRGEDLAAAAKLWTRVDQAVTDAAPLVFWSNLRSIFFVSRQVGNVQGHTAYVVLLSQMWVVNEPQPSPS